MERAEDTIVVLFRADRRDGEVFALFPELEEDGGRCTIYVSVSVGGHTAGRYGANIDISRPATEVEYAPLKTELERLGYKLVVRQHWTRPRRAL